MVKVVDFGGEKSDIKAGIEELKREMPLILEMYEERSKMRYGIFMAHQKAGFTKDEAFALVMNEVREGAL